MTGEQVIASFRLFFRYLWFYIQSESTPTGGCLTDELPSDAVLTVSTHDMEIPLLFSELVRGQQIIEHEAVVPLRSIPTLEHDDELQLMIHPQPDRTVESDPNVMDSSDHVLLPLAERSAYREDSESVSIKTC